MIVSLGDVVFERLCSFYPQANQRGCLGIDAYSCRLYRNVEVAEALAEKLFQLDTENVLMSNIYAEAGRWEYVERVRKLVKDRGLKKDFWAQLG